MSDVTPFPSILEIELTRQCNLACRMCQRNVVRFRGPEMELGTGLLASILDQLEDRCPQVNLGGLGESLLCTSLPELLGMIKKLNPGISTGLNTNGLLLTPDRWGWLTDGRLDYLTISLNAPDGPTYERLVGSSSYHKVTRNAKEFLTFKGRNAPPRTTVHSFNIPGVEAKNVEFVQNWQDLADFAQVRELGNWGGTVDLTSFGITPQVQGLCERPWTSLAIDIHGGYHRCCATFALLCPTVTLFDVPIHLFWRGTKMEKIRRRMASGDFGAGDPCRACTGRGIRPNSLIEHGYYEASSIGGEGTVALR